MSWQVWHDVYNVLLDFMYRLSVLNHNVSEVGYIFIFHDQ
jgi:hypothetical protein